MIGRELRRLREFDPKSVVFYTSGRASLETSYAYQLFARLYGNNNLPDSSNMCHESTSVGLRAAIVDGVYRRRGVCRDGGVLGPVAAVTSRRAQEQGVRTAIPPRKSAPDAPRTRINEFSSS